MRQLVALLFLAAVGCGGSPNGVVDGGADLGSVKPLRIPALGPVPALPTWDDDPITPAKRQLGLTLYFDARLSGSGRTSCSACHVYNTNFQDNLIFASPDRSYPNDTPTLQRNTLAFFNIVYAPVFRWDGSHTDFLDVVVFPFAEPNMNTSHLAAGDPTNDVPGAQQALFKKLTNDLPDYVPRYQAAFGVDITSLDALTMWRLTARALRALFTEAVSRDAPFDRWNAGDDSAMDASAVRGVELFTGKARCLACHGGPFFTDFSFHNVSSSLPGADGKRADEGRYLVTGQEQDRGKFLTPTLRQCYDTSPYFHDGQKGGLRAVIQHLSSSLVTADPNHDAVFDTPITLSADEITDLVAFLRALRGAPVTTIVPPT